MAGATFNTVSVGTEGRVAQVGYGLSWNWSSMPFFGAGSIDRRWEIK